MAKINVCDPCLAEGKLAPAKYQVKRRVAGIKYDNCVDHRKIWATKTEEELLVLIREADAGLNKMLGFGEEVRS